MDLLAVLAFWPALLRGLGVTLGLSAIAIAGGTALGLAAGIASSSRYTALRLPMLVYVNVFRGSPLLIQLFLIYLGLSYLGLNLDIFTAAALGFTLYSGAYTAEIVRSSIQALPAGQPEAALSLGLTATQTLRRVILPQSMRTATPALLSFNLGLIKDTSLASIIGFVDLVKEGQSVIAATGRPFDTYVVIGLAYFAICFPISHIVTRYERRRALA